LLEELGEGREARRRPADHVGSADSLPVAAEYSGRARLTCEGKGS
jgi:hypothetical protein